jgi:hypothetical protein
MYPIHDIDAQLLLATLIAAKRRPAELVEIVAAAELLGCPITSASLWVEAFRRFATHGLIVEADGAYALTPRGQTLGEGLPKKAGTAERVFLVREKLSAYTPAEACPAIALSTEQLEHALRAHAAVALQGGKNLLMPRPKADDDERQRRGPGRRPFAGGRRRF